MNRILTLTLLFGLIACRREPPRVLPADEPKPPVEKPHTRVEPGERAANDAVAEARLAGVYCYPLPGAVRHSLWWHAETERLEFTEQADDGHWQRVAVALPTGASSVLLEPVDSETGLPVGATFLDEPGPAAADNLRLIHFAQGQNWLVRSDAEGETLLEPSRGGPVPVVTVKPVWVQAAATVPGGVLATLLTQDTDGDGKASAEDESDVCLVARAVTPIRVAARQVPLSRLNVAQLVRRLANQALAVAVTEHWLKQSHRLQLRYSGTCALDAPQVTDKLVELHDAVTRVVGEVDLSLEVDCVPSPQ